MPCIFDIPFKHISHFIGFGRKVLLGNVSREGYLQYQQKLEAGLAASASSKLRRSCNGRSRQQRQVVQTVQPLPLPSCTNGKPQTAAAAEKLSPRSIGDTPQRNAFSKTEVGPAQRQDSPALKRVCGSTFRCCLASTESAHPMFKEGRPAMGPLQMTALAPYLSAP